MQIRELLPAEWGRLRECPWLKKDRTPPPDTARIIVALGDNGELSGLVIAQLLVTIEPVWVDERHRGRGLAPRMWKKLEQTLKALGITGVISHCGAPGTADYLKRLGYRATGSEMHEKEL